MTENGPGQLLRDVWESLHAFDVEGCVIWVAYGEAVHFGDDSLDLLFFFGLLLLKLLKFDELGDVVALVFLRL